MYTCKHTVIDMTSKHKRSIKYFDSLNKLYSMKTVEIYCQLTVFYVGMRYGNFRKIIGK